MEKFGKNDIDLIANRLADLFKEQDRYLEILEESSCYKRLHFRRLDREFDEYGISDISVYINMIYTNCRFKEPKLIFEDVLVKINKKFNSIEDFIKACDKTSIQLKKLIKSASIKNDESNYMYLLDLEDKMDEETKKLNLYNIMYNKNGEISDIILKGLEIIEQSIEEYDVAKCKELLNEIIIINNTLSESYDLDFKEDEDYPSITIEDEPEGIKYADTCTPLDYDPEDEDYEIEYSNEEKRR